MKPWLGRDGPVRTSQLPNRGGNAEFKSDAPVFMTAPQEVELYRGKCRDEFVACSMLAFILEEPRLEDSGSVASCYKYCSATPCVSSWVPDPMLIKDVFHCYESIKPIPIWRRVREGNEEIVI